MLVAEYHKPPYPTCIWALADFTEPQVERMFKVVGDGGGVEEEDALHVGSFISRSGFVTHVFELVGGTSVA